MASGRVVPAVLAILAVAAPGRAQTPVESSDRTAAPVASASAAAFKDAGTATLIAVLVPGGGHLYTGETKKGLTLLGIGMGSVIVGSALTMASADDAADCTTLSCLDGAQERSWTWFGLGMVGYLAAWAVGIADAGDSAARVNARNASDSGTPAIQPRVGVHPQSGLTIAMRVRVGGHD